MDLGIEVRPREDEAPLVARNEAVEPLGMRCRPKEGEEVLGRNRLDGPTSLRAEAQRSSPDLCVKAEEAPRLRLGCLGDLLFLEE